MTKYFFLVLCGATADQPIRGEAAESDLLEEKTLKHLSIFKMFTDKVMV